MFLEQSPAATGKKVTSIQTRAEASAAARELLETILYDKQSWRHLAACRELDTNLFFPVGSKASTVIDDIAKAKAVCADCPVRLPCLQFALVSNQEYGVWGGYDEEERRGLRRQWRKAGRSHRARRKRAGT
jgi:WhiB family redox-sensing transcriptional regulator